tara:strand:- start:90 stop:362 length:273 start_codon:yes stop_codon:yes gene_type:complete
MTTQELQISRNGQYFVSGDVTFTAAQKVAYLVVNSAAVFANLTDQAEVNIITQSNITGATLSAGIIIAPKGGSFFKRVNMTSGSVVAVFA